jgi:UrcA family protein
LREVRASVHACLPIGGAIEQAGANPDIDRFATQQWEQDMLYKSSIAALAITSVVGLVGAGQPAVAETVSIKVQYSDLNLSSDAGARTMLRRIRHAAKEACGPDTTDPWVYDYEYIPCVNAAVADGVARLGNPTVAALNGGSGKSKTVTLASSR